jgi:aspartyl-tRNA(Asn)/glutamyl-tRNA(Gln) amidotransferase subunit A
MTSPKARDIAAGVNAETLDPIEVAAAALDRCGTTGAALNALTAVDRAKTLAEARRVRDRIGTGERLPLAGVPLIVKDNIWVGGWRITQGSRLFADHVAPHDALAVARARAAGAVVVAISACSEFACKGVTATPLHGVTHHPMDPNLTPGGSSGGSAAALAAGVAPLSLGTDAGGSSRRPPAHCGIVGFKPSQGAIAHPFGFAEPFWGLSCIAPMARDVAEAALLFEAVAGPDPRDPESRAVAPADRERPLRVVFAPTLGLDAPVDDDVAEAVAAALAALRGLRHHWRDAAPTWPSAQQRAHLPALQFAGLAALHGAAYRAAPQDIDPDIGAQIERGFALTGADVAMALEASLNVRKALASFFTEHDLLLCPTTPCVAWPHRSLGPPSIGGREVDPRGHAVFTPLLNHAHAPAISIPCGRGRDGLPVGLQIAGPVGADRRVLAFAAAAEHALAEAGLWTPP